MSVEILRWVSGTGPGGQIFAKSRKSTFEPILAFLGTNMLKTPPRPIYPENRLSQENKMRESKNAEKKLILKILTKMWSRMAILAALLGLFFGYA